MYEKGVELLRAGELDRYVYGVQKGYVQLHLFSSLGDELNISILQQGEFFPLNPILGSHIQSLYWARTLTPCTLYKIPQSEMQVFIKHDIEGLYDIAKQVLRERNAFISRLQHINLGKAGTTVAAVILAFAKIFGKETKQGTLFKHPITHELIAFTAGVTRETTSNEILKLKKQGVLAYQGRHMIIYDNEALKQASLV